MAKGVLSNIDLGEDNSNLSYEGIQQFNPVQRQKPKMGTLKKVLSASKESESVSPYKKAAPKPVEIKTAKPSPQPVQQPVSPITTNVLQPVQEINQAAAPAIKTAKPAPLAVTPKPVVVKEVLEPIEEISIQDNARTRQAIKNLADRAYSGDKKPFYPRDVYENDIRTGIIEGDLSTYEDEQGNLSVKRNAPGFMTGVWEGQKSVAEGIRKAANYYVASPEEKIKLLEEDRMVESMQPMQESSTGTQVGQVAGNIIGQVGLGQAPRLIPGIGALVGSAISSTYMGAMQAYDSEKEAYNMARDSGLNEFDAYDVAEKGRGTYYTTGVAENFVSALVGARVGSAFKATASGASKGFAEAVKRFAATTGNKSLEVGLDASVAAIASAIRDAKTEETTGQDLAILDRALENAKMEAYAGGAMAVLGSAYGATTRAIPKWLKSQALNMASTMDEQTLTNQVQNLTENGVIDVKQSEKLLEDIKNWDNTSQANIDVPAEKAGVINGLTTKKQGLLDKLKIADESSAPAIQAEIDAVDAQIAESRTTPDLLAGEIDDLTGLPLIPKTITDATKTPQEQQQEGIPEGDVSQRQRIEGEQDQAPNEADNRNRPISEQEKEVRGPSVTKLLGTMKPNKITVNEMTALKRLMKFGQASSKAGFDFAKKTRQDITNGLNELKAAGKIGAKQTLSILSKYDRVNLKNPESIDRFVTYVSKVVSDATFDDKLAKAQKVRNLIKRAASIKTTQANLSTAAKQFASINPLNVQDVDEYMKIAESVLGGVKSSRSTPDLIVKFNKAFSAGDVQAYTNAQKAFIETEAKNKKLADYQDLVDSGVLSGEMNLNEIDNEVSNLEQDIEVEKTKEDYIKEYVKERFKTLSYFAKELLTQGQDEFGVMSDKKISDADKKAVAGILKTGIDKLSIKDAYRVIESLDNFITNGESYGLEDISGRYEGNENGNKIAATFKKSRPLSAFGSKSIGTFLARQIETLPLVVYRMFRTDANAAKFFRESGLQSLFNNKNRAKSASTNILTDFVNKFKGKKANGTDYNDATNTIEQGMLAFLRRNKGGSPEDIQDLFNTRKKLILEGIQNLRTSEDKTDLEKADLYQQVYDKIVAESNNITDVESKTDAVNKQVVDYWTKVWEDNYEDLRGVSKSIYRQDLDQDNAYNPDVYRKIKQEQTDEDIDTYDPFNNSGFSFNYEGNIPKKMNGTLIKQKGVTTMPEGKYIDLNFIKNSSKSIESALTDIYTAKDVRTVKAMLDSDGIKKVINKKDLAVLKEKVALYVKRTRNMDAVDYDELSALSKRLSNINRFITSTSLGSLKQPIGQTFPLALKTLIGAGRFDLNDAMSITASIYMGMDTPVNRFLNESGYGISIRGMESTANLQELSNLVKSSNGNVAKIGELLNNRNDKVLKLLLSNPDAVIARASWISYYKNALKAKGLDINNIDWDTHEIDTDAADIAQINVDTQQNVSDADMQAQFMGSKRGGTALARNILMPFSGFIMNSKAKMQADANTLISKVTTGEEKWKAFRNLVGQFAEIALYSKITSLATQGAGLAIAAAFGGGESEREKEKLAITEKKSLLTNIVNDGLSPLPPMANGAIDLAVNSILDYFNPDEPEETKIRLYEGTNKSNLENMIQNAGMLGIGAKKAIDLATSLGYATKGEVKSEFGGKESIKYLSPEEREMAAIGSIMQFLYLSRIVPIAELGTMANKINRLVEKRALTEKQQATKELVAELGAEIDTTKVDGKSVSDAIARAANFKDPEQRARYILSLQEKFGVDAVEKMYPLLEESKILNGATAANIMAIQENNPELTKFSKLFSYTKQDARIEKLLEIRKSYSNKADFYNNLAWAMQFKLLNDDGLISFADKLETVDDFTDDEFDMLLASVEE